MAAGNLPEEAPAPAPTPSARPLLMVLIAVCSILVFTYALRLDERDRMEAAIAVQQAANQEALARGARLQEELAQTTNPSFMEYFVRGVLLKGKEGEVRLVVVDGPVTAAAAAQAASMEGARLSLPVWQQWVELLVPSLFRR
jgi:hypothetical protein